jgi:hypothetical protein
MMDTDGNGKVSEAELDAAMNQHNGDEEDHEDHEDHEDNGDEEDHSEHDHEEGRGGGPTAAEIVLHCDKDDDFELSREEVHNCIVEQFKSMSDAAEAQADAMWDTVDADGSGTISESELDAIMNADRSQGEGQGDRSRGEGKGDRSRGEGKGDHEDEADVKTGPVDEE